MIAYRGGVHVMTEAEWLPREAEHHARVDEIIVPHLARAQRGIKHPVIDFLFVYYRQSAARLRRWHPGWDTGLVVPADSERLTWPHQKGVLDDGRTLAVVDQESFLSRNDRRLRGVRNLLAATLDRPGRFTCFGLHEWAMVYRQSPEQVRHNAFPLRLGSAATNEVVDQGTLRCTHFDAFRFFTESAQPRNTLALTRDIGMDHEQPGCLHAGMDLYKWAYLLTPAVGSDLMWDAFVLAMDIRELDMQAAPYDLRDLGYEPVQIETAAGRAEYATRQRGFSERSQVIRRRLLAQVDQVLGVVTR